MTVPFVLRLSLPLVCILSAASGLSQDLPIIPPSIDPFFWGRAKAPYTLTLTVTSTLAVDGNGAPRTHVTVMNVYRDSAGRVREEAFYDSGQPMAVDIRDPSKNTFTLMKVVEKSVYVRIIPPPVKGWTVERLPSRVIEGLPAEGYRFTRNIPGPASGSGAPDTTMDEEWVSNALGIVLEQKTESQRTGTTTKTVSHVAQVEPDPTLFDVPSEYTAQQNGSPVQAP